MIRSVQTKREWRHFVSPFWRRFSATLESRTRGGTTSRPVSHPRVLGLARLSLARTRILMCAPCPPTPAPTYRSKLFLDCCGLVRRAMRDLQEEFGFTIGPGNQAYQVARGEGLL